MKRVVAYCRVSTDHKEQKTSLENQKEFFEQYVNNQKGWELTKIYADEGITGTSLKKRTEFNKMYRDAHNGKFDLILTKDVCRWARNIIDSIEKAREFKKLGIEVHFISDGIKTFAPDAELKLGLMATLAQDESRRISERVQFGVIQSMKNGVAFGNIIYGYEFVKDKVTEKKTKLVVNEKEAKIVKYIFNAYLNEGKGAYTIAKELKEMGVEVKRPRNKETSTDWRNGTILDILRNVKYKGDLKQRITYTTDILEHTKKVNHGEVDFIYIENHHEPIIDRQMFDDTQKELERRSNLHKHDKSKYTNKHTFSGKLECACCGASYVGGESRKRADGTQRRTWRCYSAVNYGKKHIVEGKEVGCDNERVNDDVLKESFIKALKQIVDNKDEIQKDIERILRNVIKRFEEEEGDEVDKLLIQIERIKKEKKKSLDLCLKEIISEEEYIAKKKELEDEIQEINKEIQGKEEKQMLRDNIEQILSNARKVVDKILNIKEFSKNICKELVEKVIIHSKTKFDFYIKGYKDPYFFGYESNILYLQH